jgi:hypothetical protein
LIGGDVRAGALGDGAQWHEQRDYASQRREAPPERRRDRKLQTGNCKLEITEKGDSSGWVWNGCHS